MSCHPAPPLLGADGCRAGWVYVLEDARGVRAGLARSFAELVAVAPDAILAIDVPIGLPDAGARAADLAARAFLARPRGSSVFPAPVRSVLEAADYAAACDLHVAADGRKLSRQAFGILPKVLEVDTELRSDPALLERVVEVHPEVSFALWNCGAPMAARKCELPAARNGSASSTPFGPGRTRLQSPRFRVRSRTSDVARTHPTT